MQALEEPEHVLPQLLRAILAQRRGRVGVDVLAESGEGSVTILQGDLLQEESERPNLAPSLRSS